MAEFKDRLKELRHANGLSQQELADSLQVHAMTISGYERGIRRPDFDTLDELADKLNADMDYLLGVSDENHGYPVHIEIQNPHDEMIKAEKRMLTYFQGTTSWQKQLIEAYDKAPEKDQAAVRLILGLDDGDR